MVAERVKQARRRYLWNEMLAQGAWAVSAALAAVIFLLLLGTQVLDWQWLAALPVATLALGVWLTLRRLPPPYTIAQIVDRRLGLADSLSTAFFFDTGGRGRNVPPEVREAQLLQAERLSEDIDVRAAMPFTMPRAVYSVAILGVAASGLFALRYGLEQKLDLRTPLAGIIRQAFGLDEQQAAALDRRQPPPAPGRKRLDIEEMMQGLSVQDGLLPQEGQQQGEALDAAGSPSPEKLRQAAERVPGQQQDAKGDEMAEGGDESTGISTGSGDEGQEGQQGKQGKEGRESAGKQNSGDNSNNSLLAKFREAMQNLMSRMRQPQTGNQGGQQQSAQNQQGQKGQQKSGEGQQQGQGQQQAAGQDADGQDGQSADAQMAQNASGKGSGKSGEENSSKQPGSGIGKQDGDKEIQNAEQLAAMGKLSEILGKRSANLTGEISVEVQSNDKQQLQTPYSQRRATQGEAIAEISRDEVPLGLESYVQQYFEHVRKAPARR